MFSSTSVRTILNKAAASTLEIFESSLLLAESIFTVPRFFVNDVSGLSAGPDVDVDLGFLDCRLERLSI